MFFNSCQMVHLFHNKISVFIHNFQHITNNFKTQSSLRRVENRAEKIKHYDDGNEMSDWSKLTSYTRWKTMLTFESDLENPVLCIFIILCLLTRLCYGHFVWKT